MTSINPNDDRTIEQREAVILFADLMNSSELANNLSLPDYDRFVTVFQKKLGSVVARFIQIKSAYDSKRGFSLEADIRGDEICLKFFRASDKRSSYLSEDVVAALQVAVQMKREWLLCPENKKRIMEGRPVFDIGIGIHQGPVLLGNHYRFSSQLSSETEKQSPKSFSFSLTETQSPEGHSINLAKRIESHSRELRFSQILVGHNVYNLVDPDFRVAFRRATISPLKGISQTIPVYEVIGIGHFDDQAFEPKFDDNELEIYEQAVANNPDMIWLLLDLGHYYFDVEKYDQSAQKYQQVINIIPDFAPAHMYLGRCWFRRYRYEEARYSLERALELSQHSPRANSFLAVCLRRLAYQYKLENREGSLQLFRRALELQDRARRIASCGDPAHLWALNGLSRTIAESGKEARAHFSLNDAEKFAKEALDYIKRYHNITESKGQAIYKEHLVLDTLGYIYLKRCEERELGNHSWKNLPIKARETFLSALKALSDRNETSMGARNYNEKLSEIHFHLALLEKICGNPEQSKKEALIAMKTAKKIDQKFLQDQYWYNEAMSLC
ncbi:MAG: tetratricopeptide repeat protein [bacterium]